MAKIKRVAHVVRDGITYDARRDLDGTIFVQVAGPQGPVFYTYHPGSYDGDAALERALHQYPMVAASHPPRSHTLETAKVEIVKPAGRSRRTRARSK
jgi:hypothetical protein